jgi:PIN domain nuclease of toxin-antitoxin system
LLDLFDRTPEIYAGETIKRLKVRIALREIAAFMVRQREAGKVVTRKDVVVTAFETALKIEAGRLRAVGEIDDLEERQLCRLNITGEAVSTDPAETSGNRGHKPESWFLNLMSGQYTPVTRPLAATIRNELNHSPGFVA